MLSKTVAIAPLKGKELVVHYFDFFKENKPKKDVEYEVKCKCGWEAKFQSCKGYTNLQAHIIAAHPEYVSLTNDTKKNQMLIEEAFCPSKVRTLWGWLDWVIGDLLPFSFVEKQRVRRHSKLPSISVESFMQTMVLLTGAVEEKIKKLLPNMFALVFDGWTLGQSHYLGVFATFPDEESTTGYKKVLLSFSPMTNEESFNAATHVEYFEFILGYYGKWWDNVAALIGDNCSTNQSLATKANSYFIGCASHRFNLAMKEFFSSYEDQINKINAIMTKLKQLIPAAKLRSFTHLKAKTKNATRWSSTFAMILRYTQIKEFLPRLEINEIDDFILSAKENRDIDSLLEELKDLESVSKTLQDDSTTMSDVRSLFDAVLESYPICEERLSPSAPIVLDKVFESALVQIQRGRSAELSPSQVRSVKHLQITANPPGNIDDKSISFAERVLKKQKLQSHASTSEYMDMRFLIPTSNICERLFSKAGFTLNDRRMAILPVNAEAQMFLHLNMDLWNIDTIREIIAKSTKDTK